MTSAFGVFDGVSKSFMPTKGELGAARSISEMGPDVRSLLREHLTNTSRLRAERGGALGSLKKPSNAADRHPRAVEAARNRFQAKRTKAWEAKGSPKVGAERQPRKVRVAPVAAPAKARAKKPTLQAQNPISGRTLASIGVTTGVAGAAGYGEHRLRKSDDDPHRAARTALGTVAGAAGADALHDAAGQGLKVRNAAVRAKEWDNKKHRAIWDEHRRSHGVKQITGRTSEAVKTRLYTSYPKTLPGWRGQRALAYMSHPAAKVGVVAAGAATGAAIGFRHKQKSVAKNDRRADEVVAGVTSGAAGQGAYQAVGYGLKHHVDRNTRKPHVDSAVANARDKELKAAKKAHGMHLPNGHPGRDNVGYHRNFPKHLSYSREIRALGHTHEGRKGVLIGAGVTALAAVGGAGGVHHHMTSKSVSKYQAGTITYHQQQADLHGRKKASGWRQAALGSAVGGAGAGAAMHPHGTLRLVGAGAKHANTVRRVGTGAAVAGGALATVGVVRAVHHGRKQNHQSEKAQAARRERNAELAERESTMEKSAFGVEHIAKGAVAATLAPTIGSAASAPKGKKLRTSARTTTAGIAGGLVGGVGAAALSRGNPVASTAGYLAGKHGSSGLAYRTSRWGKEEHKLKASGKKRDV